MTKFVYMGLDTETTSTLSKGELIQIGLYVDDELHCCFDVGHRGNYYWEPEAFNVNGFTHDRIHNGHPVHFVDGALDAFIIEVKRKYSCEGKNILPVGLNIGSFDIPFVRKTLPLFYSGLGYRSIDLNALYAAFWDNPDDFARNKARITELASANVKMEGGLHDAGYDAALALECLRIFRQEAILHL